MKLMANMKVGSRLALGFGVVLAIMVALTAVAVSRMSFIQSHLDKIVEVDAAELRLVNQMRDLVRYQSVTIRDVVMQEDIAFKKGELKLMKQANATYQGAAAELAKLLNDTTGKQAMDKIAAVDAKGKAARDEAVDKSLSQDAAGAGEVIREKLRPVQLEHVAALDALLKELGAGPATGTGGVGVQAARRCCGRRCGSVATRAHIAGELRMLRAAKHVVLDGMARQLT